MGLMVRVSIHDCCRPGRPYPLGVRPAESVLRRQGGRRAIRVRVRVRVRARGRGRVRVGVGVRAGVR